MGLSVCFCAELQERSGESHTTLPDAIIFLSGLRILPCEGGNGAVIFPNIKQLAIFYLVLVTKIKN